MDSTYMSLTNLCMYTRVEPIHIVRSVFKVNDCKGDDVMSLAAVYKHFWTNTAVYMWS